MRIWVVGSGAVGLLFGGCLAASGHRVSILCQRAAQIDLLNSQPLEIEIDEQKFAAKVEAAALHAYPLDPLALEKPDLVLLAVKSMGFSACLAQLMPNLSHDVPVVPLLNGVMHYEQLLQEWPSHKIWGGVTYVGAKRLHDTAVRAEKRFRCVMGHAGRVADENLTNWAQLFNEAGIKTEAACPVRPALWQKQIFLSVQNALSSLCDLTFGQMARSADAVSLAEALCAEVVAVAHHEGIDVAEDIFTRIRQNWLLIDGHYASMRHDFAARCPSEIEAAQGYIVRLAEKHGLFVPLCRTLWQLVRAAESAYDQPRN